MFLVNCHVFLFVLFFFAAFPAADRLWQNCGKTVAKLFCGKNVAKLWQNFSGKTVAKPVCGKTVAKLVPLYFGIEFCHSFAPKGLAQFCHKKSFATSFATKSVLPQFSLKRSVTGKAAKRKEEEQKTQKNTHATKKNRTP